MALVRCPVGFSEAMMAVFQIKKSQIYTEKTKFSKFSILQSFFAFFVEVSTDFLDWIVSKIQQGKGWLSSSDSRRDNCNVLNENVTN